MVLLAVRRYLRHGLSYRDVEELVAERGINVDRWFVDETYAKVAGVWRYVYRAVDQHGQVIDVLVSKRRNLAADARFFEMMLVGRERPREVTTDLAAPLLRVVDDLLPEVLHDTAQYGNNRIEWDDGRHCCVERSGASNSVHE